MGASLNLLLNSLSAVEWDAVKPHLRTVDLAQGDVLYHARETIRRIYFPHSGIISLVIELLDGDSAEIAMLGRDSVLAGAAALGGRVALNKAIMQIAGSASVLDVQQLETLTDNNKNLRAILLRHEQSVLVQAQQSVACNASHLLQERLARWLLRARDLTGSDEMNFTQEFLAQMLGTRRTSVSMVASTYSEAGIISYSRGRIRILNVEALRNAACECYSHAKSHIDWLVSGVPPPK